MRISLLGLLVLLLSVVSASAQTVTRTLNWNQPNATLAEVQGYTYTTQVDAAPPVITKPSCVAGTPVTCTAPITFASGPHTITLTAINAFGQASASLSGAPPSTPISVTVTIAVTIP